MHILQLMYSVLVFVILGLYLLVDNGSPQCCMLSIEYCILSLIHLNSYECVLSHFFI